MTDHRRKQRETERFTQRNDEQATPTIRTASRLARDAAQLLLLPDPNALTLDPVRAPAKKVAKNQPRKKHVVPRGGIEPPTPAFSVQCSTN
jgi:hypothetical protein